MRRILGRALYILTAVIGTALVVGAPACQPERPDTDTSRPAQFGFQVSLGESLIQEGHVAYLRYCIGCHGEKGDGKGEAAIFLDPKPRDFTNALYKFSSTRSGQLPTDEDLKRTLRNGLKGSAMPPFGLLPDQTLNALVAYIKTFSPKWSEREPAAPIPTVANPFQPSDARAEAIRRGEMVYHGFAVCWSCHPAYVPEEKISEYLQALGNPARDEFRPDLHEPVGKPNEEGEMIYPPDFRRDFVRAGMKVEDLYRSIAAGITGTAMPTWVDSITVPGKEPEDSPIVSQDDLWAMAYYLESLIAQRPAVLAENQIVVRGRPRPIYLHGAPPMQEEPANEEDATPVDFDFE